MRLPLATVIAIVPSFATADACLDEIHALFDGPLDPFQRPAYSQTTRVIDASGAQVREMLSFIETPLRTIAGDPSANWFTMSIDGDIWNGPSPEGPWTSTGTQMPADFAATMRRTHAEQKANLSDITCHGAGADGQMRYSYRTQTTPDATGSFFGSYNTITLDPEMGQIVAFEMTEFVNPWTEGVSMETWDITVTFDPEIKVVAPD